MNATLIRTVSVLSLFALTLTNCKKEQIEPLRLTVSAQETTNGTVNFSAGSNSRNSISEDDYLWEFGDGSVKQGNQNNVTYTYKKNGSYNVTLTVSAKDGRTAKNVNTIEVKSVR